MAPADDRPIWEILLEGARSLGTRGISEFTRLELVEYVQSVHPGRARSSIDPIIQGMTDNASGGPASACGVVFHRSDRGRYRLIETSLGSNESGPRTAMSLTSASEQSSNGVEPRLRRPTMRRQDRARPNV